MQVKGRTNTIAFQATKSSPIVNTPIIVKGGHNFITLNNLTSTVSKKTASNSVSAGGSKLVGGSKSVGPSNPSSNSVSASGSKS